MSIFYNLLFVNKPNDEYYSFPTCYTHFNVLVFSNYNLSQLLEVFIRIINWLISDYLGVLRKSTASFTYAGHSDSSYFRYAQYNITYRNSFDNNPGFIFGIVGMTNCPGDNQHYVKGLYRIISTSLTNIVIEG